MSPAPQYAFQSEYNAPTSPPMGAYTHDAKYEANGGAAELGGGSHEIAPAAPAAPGSPPVDATQGTHAAELSASDIRPVHTDRLQ